MTWLVDFVTDIYIDYETNMCCSVNKSIILLRNMITWCMYLEKWFVCGIIILHTFYDKFTYLHLTNRILTLKNVRKWQLWRFKSYHPKSNKIL